MKYLKLIRIKHWIKNILIFLPIICAGLLNINTITKTALGVLSFSLMSSFIYIINDIKDIEKDKNHPRKKNRPLASGIIKKQTAIIIAVVMLILSLSITIIINKNITNPSLYILISYMIINLAYSLGLKNVAIIDVALLASGFILRVYYGAAIFNIEVSNWLFLTILNASLFLGLGKRRKELINTKNSRIVLKDYNESFLEKFQYLTLTLTLVFYSLWTIEQNIKYLYITIPLLMLIFMKYCLYIEKNDEGDPITILFEDKTLIMLCLIYGISMLVFLVVL
ncbi:MAG: UbiA prenyltransferase family protein [Bacilli bacterium]|nr:UbiA prenyltransferase family protein [Bacilli bacterium]